MNASSLRGVQWSLKMQTNSGINYNIVHENQSMSVDGIKGHLQGVEWEEILQAQPKEEMKNREMFHRKKREVINEETEDYLYAKVKKRGWSNIAPPRKISYLWF